jgi:hypothetical protein
MSVSRLKVVIRFTSLSLLLLLLLLLVLVLVVIVVVVVVVLLAITKSGFLRRQPSLAFEIYITQKN